MIARRSFLFAAACLFLGSECGTPIACGAASAGPHEAFDDVCENGVCRWTVTQGDGTVEPTSTIHAGEHGLRFFGGDVTATNANLGTMQFFGSSDVTVTLSARCDPGSSLLLRLNLFAVTGGTDPVGVYELAVQPIQTWSSARTATMTAEVPIPPDPTGAGTARALFSISKVGPGSCEVDDLDLSGGFPVFCE